MAIHFDRVEPGDLITAALINRLLDEVDQHEARLAALEASTGPTSPAAPVITARSPTGDIMVGTQLTVLGRNFLVPSDQNTVSIGGVTIDQFLPFSNDTTLSFSIPNQFTSLPADLPLTVRNRNGVSAPITIRLIPLVVIPTGEVIIANTTPPLGVIETGAQHPQGYDFTFSVESATTVPETYEFSVIYANVSGSSLAAWLAGTQITPAGRRVIASGHPLTVTVHLLVPTGASSVDLALHVRSLLNDAGLSRTSDPVHIVVGQAGEVSHAGVAFTLEDILTPTPGDTARKVVIDGLDGYEIQFGHSGNLPVRVEFSAPAEPGLYRFTAQVENPGGQWTLGTVVPDRAGETVPGEETLSIPLTCNATGPSAEQRTMVVRAFLRNSTDTADQWSAFRRFPIRGYA